MGYFDGNTVTALWHYAQHFAMNDNAWTDTYGPSTPGALHLVSGQTNGDADRRNKQAAIDAGGGLLLYGGRPGRLDHDQRRRSRLRCLLRAAGPGDDGGKNIGDLLNALASRGAASWAASTCRRRTPTARPTASAARNRPWSASHMIDYIPHHNWFQYYASTANPEHARPEFHRCDRLQLCRPTAKRRIRRTTSTICRTSTLR